MAETLEYQEKYISAADGLKLYVRDYKSYNSSKRPVLCLAGLTRNSQDFNRVAADLHERGHRVICFDYRGRGKSDYDANWSNYTPQTYVSDIFQICTSLNLHGAIFIGTSLGGLLSMAMTVVAPSFVHSVVLNDVGPDLDEKGLEKIISYTSDSRAVKDLDGAVEKLKRHYADEEGFEERDWHRIAKHTYKLADGAYIPNWDVKIAENLKLSKSQEERADLWPYFHGLAERPVFVVRGAVSNVFKQETYEKMLQSLPNITGVTLEGIGHAPTLEEEALQSDLISFLDK